MLATGASRHSPRRRLGRPAVALLAIGVFLLTTVFVTSATAYIWPSDSSPTTRSTAVGSVQAFEPGSVTLLREFDIPGYLVRLEGGEFLAFHLAEPVNGCSLPWQPRLQVFRDPCRGFEYDITGQPSPDNAVRVPMTALEFTIDRHDTIRVTAPVATR